MPTHSFRRKHPSARRSRLLLLSAAALLCPTIQGAEHSSPSSQSTRPQLELQWQLPLGRPGAKLEQFETPATDVVTIKNSTDYPFVIVSRRFGAQWQVPAHSRVSRDCTSEFQAQLRAVHWPAETATFVPVTCGDVLLIKATPEQSDAAEAETDR